MLAALAACRALEATFGRERLAAAAPALARAERTIDAELLVAAAKAAEKGAAAAGPALDGEAAKRATQDSVSALMMIRAYRIRGHLIADLEPLGLKERLTHEELNPETYGFGAADMDREVYINNVLGLGEIGLTDVPKY